MPREQELIMKTMMMVLVAWMMMLGSAVAGEKGFPDLPEPVTSFGAAVAGDWLYVYGGHLGRPHRYFVGTTSGRFHRINLKHPEKWEELPGGPARQGLGMVAHGGKIYRIGGMSPHNREGEAEDLYSSNLVTRFDPATGKWEELTPLPEKRSSFDAAVAGDKLYVIGGWILDGGPGSSGKWHGHGWVADLTANVLKWEKIETPFSQRALALVADGKRVYAMGGMDEEDRTTGKIWVLDAKSGEWTPGADLPIANRMKGFGVGACVIDGVVHAMGGDGVLNGITENGAGWQELGKAAGGRIFHRMIPIDGNRVLLLGGAAKGVILKQIETLEAHPRESAVNAANGSRWPAFRGDGTGHTVAKNLPVKWGKEAIAWQADLEGYGQSSPVVWDGKVFVTSIDGEMKEKLIVTCLELASGKQLWKRNFEGTQKWKWSDMVSKGAPTPVVDPRGVYALFESGDLIALDHEGEVLWKRALVKEYGEITGNHGLGNSLGISEHAVIVQLDHASASFILAADKKTGTTLWRAEREKRVAWTTPVVVREGNREEVISSSNGSVAAYDAADGQKLWEVTGIVKNTTNSPVVAGDMVIVGTADAAGSVGVRRGGEGRDAKLAWKGDAPPNAFASAAIVGDKVYAVGKAGVVTCLDLQTGKALWSERLEGECWASPIVTKDELIYFFAKEGVTTVLRGGNAGPQIVGVNGIDMPEGQRIYGVAAVDGAFVVRMGKRVVCAGSPQMIP